MDNENPTDDGSPAAAGARMPKGPSYLPSTAHEPFAPLGDTKGDRRTDVALSAPREERTGVFRQLVSDDGDIAGLVAYSIYKQNKLDWLNAFTSAKGRAPNDDELASYIIGEGTPRRLATYRHLAEATLAGDGPQVGGEAGEPRTAFRRGGLLGDKRALTASLLATYALIAVLFVIGFMLAAHYTMSSR